MRKRKTTRFAPLVFVDGKPEKVEAIRKLLPDAAYTTWETIASRTIATKPVNFILPTPAPKRAP